MGTDEILIFVTESTEKHGGTQRSRYVDFSGTVSDALVAAEAFRNESILLAYIALQCIKAP